MGVVADFKLTNVNSDGHSMSEKVSKKCPKFLKTPAIAITLKPVSNTGREQSFVRLACAKVKQSWASSIASRSRMTGRDRRSISSLRKKERQLAKRSKFTCHWSREDGRRLSRNTSLRRPRGQSPNLPPSNPIQPFINNYLKLQSPFFSTPISSLYVPYIR